MVVALAKHFAPAAPAWPPRLQNVPTIRSGVAAADALGLRPAQGGPVPSPQCMPTVANSAPVHQQQKRVRFGPVTRTRTFPRTPQCMKRTLWQDAAAREIATRESWGCPHLQEVQRRVPQLALLEQQRRGRSPPRQERICPTGILRAPGDRRYVPSPPTGNCAPSSVAASAGSHARRQPGRAGPARSKHQVLHQRVPTAVPAVARPGTRPPAAAVELEGAPTGDGATSPAAASAESNTRRQQGRADPARSRHQVPL